MNHNYFIHLSVSGRPGCFHVLTIVNSAAMNIGVHVSFSVMIFSRYMPCSGIAGMYDSFIAKFLRYLHTVLHSGCINLHSNQQRFSTPSPAFIVYKFFDDGHSDQHEVIPLCSFDFHFSSNKQ